MSLSKRRVAVIGGTSGPREHMTHSQFDIVVVGAGQAGGELVVAARQGGFEGTILLIGEEPFLPYQRPPLSKAYLLGELSKEALLLKAPALFEKLRVEVRLQARVNQIDRVGRTLRLSSGETVRYGKLAVCTGGRVRRLNVDGSTSGQEHPNLHYLRSIADADRLHEALVPGNRFVLIGGGYIGLEVAAVARQRGIDVTVIEAMPRVLARVTSPEVSAFYERVHRDAGVVIRTNTPVNGLEVSADRRVTAVVCGDGTREPCDALIVGIGLIPNTELAQQAGLAVDNGIVVDECARTRDPDIWAAGDCTNFPNGHYGRRMRLESVPNAIEQARVAAAGMVGKVKTHDSVPWFWSDQYDLKLQTVGLSEGYDQVVIRGSMQKRSFAAFFLREHRVIAVDSVNRPAEFVFAKRLVTERVPVTAERLSDESTPLKDCLKSLAATA